MPWNWGGVVVKRLCDLLIQYDQTLSAFDLLVLGLLYPKGTGCEPEAHLESWRLTSRLHQAYEVEFGK